MGVDPVHSGGGAVLKRLPLQAPAELRAEAGGFLEGISGWSQLIMMVKLASVGEHPQIHEKKVVHRRYSS